MDSDEKVIAKVEGIALRAEEYLEGVDPSPFSRPAFSVLKGRISQYVKDLVGESLKIRDLDRADSVSVKHVELASVHMTLQAGRKIYKHCGTVGGIFLGASLSNLLSMMSSSQYSSGSILITVFLGIAGASLITLNIAKD